MASLTPQPMSPRPTYEEVLRLRAASAKQSAEKMAAAPAAAAPANGPAAGLTKAALERHLTKSSPSLKRMPEMPAHDHSRPMTCCASGDASISALVSACVCSEHVGKQRLAGRRAAGLARGRVAILMVAMGTCLADYGHHTVAINLAYAEKHGYDMGVHDGYPGEKSHPA